MQPQANATTYSQKRVKQLQEHSNQISREFNTKNFYENNQINVPKLKQKILQAKQKLLTHNFISKQSSSKNTSIKNKQIFNISHQQPNQSNNHQQFILYLNNKNPFNSTDHRYQPLHCQRFYTDIGNCKSQKNQHASFKQQRQCRFEQQTNSRLSTQNNLSQVYKKQKNDRFSSLGIPSSRHTHSVISLQLQNKKITLINNEQLKQLQTKIKILWQLYEILMQLTQQSSKTKKINQKLVTTYITFVCSQKLQFIYQLIDHYKSSRITKTIKQSRVLQYFSVFQTCLNHFTPIKIPPAQIINYLGYSSSSVIFIIKVLLLTYSSNIQFSQDIEKIITAILIHQANQYHTELTNIKQVLRRLQHNNQIISMIKTKYGKKNNKYCQQFMNKVIKYIQKQRTPFSQTANNIFEFLSFYLHYENVADELPIISIPPSPFLSLTFTRTIVIEPWSVLAYQKHKKIVIRPHTGKFIAQILTNCNLIFWTQLMPKDAQILVNLMPVKHNIHWLYSYHCRQDKYQKIKAVQMIGCNVQNTIIIDNSIQHYLQNQDIGINMCWHGDRNDTKLLKLSQLIQQLFSKAIQNNTSLKTQLQNSRSTLNTLIKSKKKNKIIKSGLIHKINFL